MNVTMRREGNVAFVTIDDPATRNALDDALVAELDALLAKLSADESLDVIAVTGTGRAFSSGGSFEVLGDLVDQVRGPGGHGAVRDRIRANGRVVERIRSLPQLTIAAVNGACVGAALGIACAFDLRIASESAFFLTGFQRLGLTSDFGAGPLLAATVGEAAALRLLLVPERVSAEEAHRLGLVSAVVPGDRLEQAVLDLAVEVPSGIGRARVLQRETVTDARSLSLELDAEADRFATSIADPRTQQRILAAGSRG